MSIAAAVIIVGKITGIMLLEVDAMSSYWDYWDWWWEKYILIMQLL